MKALPIHRYKLIVKRTEKSKSVEFEEISAENPLKNTRIIKKILKHTSFKNDNIEDLIVTIEKGDYLGMSNKIY